ncbi:MAG TPA: PhnD/SsuA/transferrin family substrate-binding protein, partial [Methylomirabilota bacterium]|nr:PhnD/SsuA/transferrin family substrate-binding protein [Methylomirabilota bacterium]
MRDPIRLSRREVVAGAAASVALSGTAFAQGDGIRFGLTPVFLSSDLDLLDSLKSYLETATDRSVHLVTRRTYQEITSLLVSGELDAAWICGYPFVSFRDRLSLVAVPVWRGRPLYQSYLLSAAGRN